MFLSTKFQRIIYGAINCQFYFPLLGHHSKLKLSQKYQGIHHLLFFIKISVSTILQEPCYNTLHQYQYGQCKVGDHSWILLGVRGQYSQQHSTPLTAAATWLQLCTLWQLCCRECCTAHHLTSVTNGWEHCTAFINSPPPHSMSYDGNCNNNTTTATTETFSIWMWGHKGLLPGDPVIRWFITLIQHSHNVMTRLMSCD